MTRIGFLSSAAWPTSPSPSLKRFATLLRSLVAVGREQPQLGLAVARRRLDEEERAVLRADERRQLGHDQPRHRLEVALALQHAGEAGQVRVEPVLLRVPLASSRGGCAIIWLMLSLSSATSPCASTVIERVRSPWVTAVETSAIARTWVVSVRGELVDVVGQVLPHAGDALDLRLAAELALGADLARDARHLVGERRELVDHGVDRVLRARAISPLASTVIFWERSPLATAVVDLGDVAHLVGEVAGQLFTLSVRSLHVPETPFTWAWPPSALGADLVGHARDLVGEGRELVDHRVDRVLELEDLAPHVDRDLPGQVAVRDGGRDLGDVAHLVGQVATP